ncbi:MAG TPA: serine/threonine-protein kinase [Polyangiaceae bacterium]
MTTHWNVSDTQNSDGGLEALFERTPYRPLRRMQNGGMGEFVLVEHREVGRVFVAKVLPKHFATDPVLVDRLRLEAQSLGALAHENIVSVVGIDRQSDGRPFFVMERLDGNTLGEELAQRATLPLLEATGYALEVLSALEAAHARGIVHRDIKPENVFLHRTASGRRTVKLLDFGIARVLPGVSAHGPRPLLVPTQTGAVVGTPRFISPEGASGERVDQRADLYSVGLLLYVMLAGRGPFDDRADRNEMVNAHATARPSPPSHFAPEPLPPELDRVILKALEKSPDERYQNAPEFARALRNAADSFTRAVGWAPTTSFDAPPTTPDPLGVPPDTARDTERTNLTSRTFPDPFVPSRSTPASYLSGYSETRTAAVPVLAPPEVAPPPARMASLAAAFVVIALGTGWLASELVGALRAAWGGP